MNLYFFKVDKLGQGEFRPGFCFCRPKKGYPRTPHLHDHLLRNLLLQQQVEMPYNKLTVLNGFLLVETTTPKLLVDLYEGKQSTRALLHIKARVREVDISPARSETVPLMHHEWPQEGYKSWIYEMRTKDIIDIHVREEVYRMTFQDGQIECEKIDLD